MEIIGLTATYAAVFLVLLIPMTATVAYVSWVRLFVKLGSKRAPADASLH